LTKNKLLLIAGLLVADYINADQEQIVRQPPTVDVVVEKCEELSQIQEVDISPETESELAYMERYWERS
jgi:hypothetical protein